MFEKLTVVNPPASMPLTVTWDLGRRCNYDCSYCPSHRHDNFSPHASLEDLKSAANFVFNYSSQIIPYKKLSKTVSFSFTGGEPTLNPHFFEFSNWIRQQHKNFYKDKFILNLSVTTNGAFNQNNCDNLINYHNLATISYHCEASEKLKAQVKKKYLLSS